MDTSVAKLLNTASLLMDKLSAVSNRIFDLEDKLRKYKFGIPFCMTVDKNDERELFLSWEKDENSSKDKCRFFMTKLKDGQLLLKKPLLQTNVEQKIEFYPFWNTFLEKFQSHLQEMTHNAGDI